MNKWYYRYGMACARARNIAQDPDEVYSIINLAVTKAGDSCPALQRQYIRRAIRRMYDIRYDKRRKRRPMELLIDEPTIEDDTTERDIREIISTLPVKWRRTATLCWIEGVPPSKLCGKTLQLAREHAAKVLGIPFTHHTKPGRPRIRKEKTSCM